LGCNARNRHLDSAGQEYNFAMNRTQLILLAGLAAMTLAFCAFWWRSARLAAVENHARPTAIEIAIGFVINFFDTLGIGSFAPTTAIFRLKRVVPDELIPGTMNVGHAIPTLAEALIFIAAVQVDPVLLVAMLAAAVLGSWLGAGRVVRFDRQVIQFGMGAALAIAAALFAMKNLDWLPGGGAALALSGWKFWCAVGANLVFGALMTLGVGLFAPCMITLALLGMSPTAAFPIMMGSCAFLMPVANLRFLKSGKYLRSAALGLAIGGVPGVLLAAFVVKSLPLVALRWLVVIVVTYVSASMLWSATRANAVAQSGAAV
jgi:uncharacterized membrane protein YfcA